MECSAIVKEFDESNRKFSKEIEYLLNIYADAAENVTFIDLLKFILILLVLY